MTLACPLVEFSNVSLGWSIVWSALLLAPAMAFLFLPRLLPLRRELAWTRARLLLPLAWLSSRLAGDRAGARGWYERAHAAWLRDVARHHPSATSGRLGEVAADARLVGRARTLGRIVGGMLLVGGMLAAAGTVTGSGDGYRVPLAIALVAATAVSAWLARVVTSAALYAGQAAALGSAGLTRFVVGGAIGLGYGAIGGFVLAFAAFAVGMPVASLLTLEAPRSIEAMYALSIGGVLGAFVGAGLGATLVATVALVMPARRGAAAVTAGDVA